MQVNAAAHYSYDSLNRRVQEGATSLYYSQQWQVIEERVDDTATFTYAWSPVYVDAMIARDDEVTPGRLYALTDANWNVVALFEAGNGVVERYVYDPYGRVKVLDKDWIVRGGGEISDSSFTWVYLHQGGRWDDTVGMFAFRTRDYSPSLMRWNSLGANVTFRFAEGNPNAPARNDIKECAVDTLIQAFNLLMSAMSALPGLLDTFPRHKNNPHQHCVWNCRMTISFGLGFASEMSRRKEQLDVEFARLGTQMMKCGVWHLMPDFIKAEIQSFAESANQKSDWWDNFVGRSCGMIIKTGNPRPDRSNCEKCCTGMGIGPQTPEGPGTPRPFGPCWPPPNPLPPNADPKKLCPDARPPLIPSLPS